MDKTSKQKTVLVLIASFCRIECAKVSLSVCCLTVGLYSFPSTSGGTFSDDGGTALIPLSVAECHSKSLSSFCSLAEGSLSALLFSLVRFVEFQEWNCCLPFIIENSLLLPKWIFHLSLLLLSGTFRDTHFVFPVC